MTNEEIEIQLKKFFSNLEKIKPADIAEDYVSYLQSHYENNMEALVAAPYTVSDSYSDYCYAGGLVKYVNQFIRACKGVYALWSKMTTLPFPEDDFIFIAYCCDLGKLVVDGSPVFLDNDNTWEVNNRGIKYKWNTNVSYMKYNELSLYVLQQIGITLDSEHYLAVKLQNGLYDESNKEYLITYGQGKSLKSPMPYMIQQAKLMINNI